MTEMHLSVQLVILGSGMKLSKKHIFRKYEGTLFHSESGVRRDKVYGFYLLLRPVLGWAKVSLMEKGLCSSEAESELYLLTESLFAGYDCSKSSLVPYLEKQIPWYVSKMLKEIDSKMCLLEAPSGLLEIYGCYETDEEFYWRTPGILLEDRFIGKSFTRAEKYIISIIIVSDDNKLSVQKLAKACNMDRKRMKSILADIKEVLQTEESHG